MDALDAARSDKTRRFAFNLIRRFTRRDPTHWTVVASIRTYDATRSRELPEIFPEVAAAADPRFRLGDANCRHFWVPPLNDFELADVEGLPWLPRLLCSAPEELLDLMRVPFHLWLLDRLFGTNISSQEVTAIRSQVQLLERFWLARVRSPDDEAERHALLLDATRRMVDQRSLSVRREDLLTAHASAAWRGLYSDEVIRDADSSGQRVAFAHNVLYDYAVSVLLLDDDAPSLSAFLADDPSRAVFLRPSLALFFGRLWFFARSTFWNVLDALASHREAHISLAVNVIPPTVIAAEARDAEDIAPLLGKLSSTDYANRIVVRVFQTLSNQSAIDHDIWSRVALQISQTPTRQVYWDVSRYLEQALRATEDSQVRGRLNEAARNLLAWALDMEDAQITRAAGVWLVQTLAETYDCAPAESRSAIERIIDTIGRPHFAIDLIWRLADAANQIWVSDPELVGRLYRRVFSHLEESDDPTHMGGIVVALRSNRRQDFDMVQYSLLEAAPAFLRESPGVALQTLVEVVNEMTQLKEVLPHRPADYQPEVLRFKIGETDAVLLRDGSYIWDAPGTHADEHQRLMTAVTDYLTELEGPEAARALDEVAAVAQVAFVWRRLLGLGVQQPETWGVLLAPALEARPILDSSETAPEAADLLGAVAPTLDSGVLRRIERAIISQATEDEGPPWWGRLIVRIPETRLTEPESHKLRADVAGDNEAATNPPLTSFRTWSEPYDANVWLHEEGVDVDSPEIATLLESTQPLEAFGREFANEPLSAEAVQDVLRTLRTVRARVASAGELPDALERTVQTRIAETAETLSRGAKDLSESDLALVRDVLLAAARHRFPEHTEVRDGDGDGEFKTPAWSPAPRTEAAQGLPRIAAISPDAELLAAIHDLSKDPVPAVRYLVALGLPGLVVGAPDDFWSAVDGYVRDESNATVIDVIGAVLGRVATSEREADVVDRLMLLIQRADYLRQEKHRLPSDDHLAALLVGMAVARANEAAEYALERAIAEAHPANLSTLAWHLFEFIDVARISEPKHLDSAGRAANSLDALARRAFDEISVAAKQEPTERDEPRLKGAFEAIDAVLSRIYFNSGLYERDDRPEVESGALCRYFAIVAPVIGTVCDGAGGSEPVGLPARSAHHLVEFLRGALPCAPADVLHFTRLTIDASQATGYAFDSLAAREVTGLVETALADYRDILREGEPLMDLVAVLDAFVDAGWPEARNLVARLDEIFR